MLIIGFDYDRNAATFFRSAPTRGWGYGEPSDLTLAATVHASTNDWCSLWVAGTARNQPIRMDGQTLAVEIGYGGFAEGIRAWQVLSAPQTVPGETIDRAAA